MRVILTTLALLACGSGNPIDSCASVNGDCCETDQDCLDYYGAEFQYCYEPGGAAVCSECTRNEHCDGGDECDVEADGGFCLPPA